MSIQIIAQFKTAHLNDGKCLPDLVMQVSGNGTPLTFFNQRQFGGKELKFKNLESSGDGIYYAQLDIQNYYLRKDYNASQWVLKTLLQQGYEPFAASDNILHLRRKISPGGG